MDKSDVFHLFYSTAKLKWGQEDFDTSLANLVITRTDQGDLTSTTPDNVLQYSVLRNSHPSEDAAVIVMCRFDVFLVKSARSLSKKR